MVDTKNSLIFVLQFKTMATKTFKIGEYCRGGIITATVSGKTITLILKDWDYSTGSNKSSDQSNAQELERRTIEINSSKSDDPYRSLLEILTDWTTSYYAEEVIEWIQTKVTFNRSLFW